MDSVIFYQPPTSLDSNHGRAIAPRNFLSSALYNRSTSDSARNRSAYDKPRRLDGEVVMSNSDGPRRDKLQPSIPASNQSLDGLKALADDGDELPSFMDILSRSRPVIPRVTSPVVDLTIDPSDDTTCPSSLSLSTSPQRGLPNPSMESPSVAAVHDAPLAATPPRKSPFRNRPSWAIRKPTLGTLPSIVKAPPQTTSLVDAVDISKGMTEICSWPVPEKTTKLGVPPSSVYESRWSGASLEDDLAQESVGANKAADGHNDNATSTIPTGGREAHRPEGPGNTSPRSNRSGFALQDVEADVSSTEIDNIMVLCGQSVPAI